LGNVSVEASLNTAETDDRRSLLLRLTDTLRELEDPEQVIAAASEMLGSALTAGQVSYAEVDASGDFVTIEREWNDGSIPSNARVHRLEEFGPDFIADLRRGALISINDVTLDSRTNLPEASATFKRASIGGFLNIPLVKQGRLAVVLAIHNREPRAWSREDIQLAEEVAERTWSAVFRVRAELALRESEAQYRALYAASERKAAELQAILESMPEGVYIGGRDGITLANQAALDQLGFASREELNRSVDTLALEIQTRDVENGALIPPEEQAFTRAFLGEHVQDVRVRHRITGEERIVRCAAAPVAVDGKVIAAVAVNTDVTERRRDEERLRLLNETLEERVAERTRQLELANDQLHQAQKLEAMGSLTGGVAHDFNNLLTPIIGSLDMLVRRGVGNERERRLIEGGLQSAERAKTLVQRLLAFARRQPLQATAVDVSDLVESMGDMIASSLGPTIAVKVEIGDDLPTAMADRNQLEMALLNLALNARDAMPRGGNLTIKAVRNVISAGHKPGLRAGAYVCICVVDSGTGMDETTAERAIEPFFSTKGIGQGTGLGLSMVHGLTAQLGGGLFVESELGHGTTIEVWLPVSGEPIVGREKATEPIPVRQAKGLVLLVDDEKLVRLSTADMLADLGWDVVEAMSGEQALQFTLDGLTPDLVVTDHLMPGMTGEELVRLLREARPALPALIVSGYAEAGGIDTALARLTKPFRIAELAASIRDLALSG
jgi:PAS domain S-box-containing protein